MAVCSVCVCRTIIASAAKAATKTATATFTVVSNGNIDAGYFQDTLDDCSQ